MMWNEIRMLLCSLLLRLIIWVAPKETKEGRCIIICIEDYVRHALKVLQEE